MNDREVRKKPWYRLRNLILGGLALLVLLLGWAFLEVWQVYTGEPKVTRDYRAEFRRMSEKAAGVPQGSGDEAWAILIDAAARCNDVIKECEAPFRSGQIPVRSVSRESPLASFIDFDLMLEGRSLPNQIDPELGALELLRQRGVFDRLAEFTESGVGFRSGDQSSPMMFEAMSEIGRMRNLAKARAASMRIALTDNDADEACKAFDEILAMGRTVSHQPSVVFHLVAVSICKAGLDEFRHLLMEHNLTASTCRQLLDSLNRHPLADTALGLKGERACFHDFVQRFYTDNGWGNGYVDAAQMDLVSRSGTTPATNSLWGSALGRFVLASRAETLSRYDAHIDMLISEASLLPSQRWQRGFDPSSHDFRAWGFRHAMLALILPAIQKYITNVSFAMQVREATRVMIALEMFHASHNRWPASLDELTPDVLPQPPRDPLHGGPFGYRVLENDPHGRPYLLYSFGLDETDDGGKTVSPPRNGDLTMTPEDHKALFQRKHKFGSYDFILNTPRKPSRLEEQSRDEASRIDISADRDVESEGN